MACSTGRRRLAGVWWWERERGGGALGWWLGGGLRRGNAVLAVLAVERGDDGGRDDIEGGAGEVGDVFDDASGLLGGYVGEQVGDVVYGGDAQFGAVGPVGVAVDELVQAVVDDGLDEGPGPVAEPFPQRGDAVGAGEQVGRVDTVGEYGGAQVQAGVGVQQVPGTFGGGDAAGVGVVGGGDAVPTRGEQCGELGDVVGAAVGAAGGERDAGQAGVGGVGEPDRDDVEGSFDDDGCAAGREPVGLFGQPVPGLSLVEDRGAGATAGRSARSNTAEKR